MATIARSTADDQFSTDSEIGLALAKAVPCVDQHRFPMMAAAKKSHVAIILHRRVNDGRQVRGQCFDKRRIQFVGCLDRDAASAK